MLTVDHEKFLHSVEDPRYRGAAIPSKAFKMLQQMTDNGGGGMMMMMSDGNNNNHTTNNNGMRKYFFSAQHICVYDTALLLALIYF